ncbi:MAG: hypothetical protein QM488_09370 [Rhizobiaceae bacterium]
MNRNTFSAWKVHAKIKFLTIGILGVLPLAGCTSNGFSGLTDGMEASSSYQPSAKPTQQATYNSSYQPNTLAPIAAEPTRLGPPRKLPMSAQPTSQSMRMASVDGTIHDGSSKQLQAYGTIENTEESRAEQRIARLFPTIKHGTCKNGWGMQAQKLDHYRYTPGDPYYIEIRMRNTPPLPIGHTYTAYGRLDAQGKKLDEHLVMLAPIGGFAGAGIAGAVPMPSRMMPQKNDCKEKPRAAYRVSLSAVQYEKLLVEVKQAKIDRPKYHLFAYNCNHFTSRISESVGIKTPSNKYTTSLTYMYDIIKENEGWDYKRDRS